MIAVKLIELALGLGVIVLLVTQVVIPLAQGSHLFPLFRKDGLKDLETKLEDAYHKEVEAKVKEEIATVESRVKAKEDSLVAKANTAVSGVQSEVQNAVDSLKGKK